MSRRFVIDQDQQKQLDDEVEAIRDQLSLYQKARMYLQLRNGDYLSEPLARELVWKEAPRKEVEDKRW